MASFFSTIFANIIPVILGWLAGYISKLIHGWAVDKQNQAADEKKNEDARKALENAETPEERDAAAKDISSKF